MVLLNAAGKNDDGLSSVVSAVLVFGLIATMMVLWTVQTLPDWVEEREAEHQQETVERFGMLRAGLDALSANGDAGPVRVGIPVAPSPIPLVQSGAATGRLEAEGAVQVTGSFQSPRLHLLDGQPLGSPDEPVAGQTIHGIDVLRMLTIELATTSVGNGDTAWVEVLADDGTDTAAARITHLGGHPNCQDAALVLSIDATAQQEQLLSCGLSDTLAGRPVDLMEPVYGYAAAVARLERPYSLTFTEGFQGATSTATFASVWSDSDGRTQAAGGGQAAPFSIAQSGQALVHRPGYQEHPDQVLQWEAGAFVRVQPDGAAILKPPSFSLTVDGTTGHLQWTIVEVSGTGAAGGTRQADVVLQHTATRRIVMDVDSAEFTLDGVSGEAWHRYLRDQALLGGAAAATDTTLVDEDTVQLTLGGAITTWRLDFRLVQATILIE